MKRLTSFLKISSAVIFCVFFLSTVVSAKYYPDNYDNVIVHKSTSEKMIALTFDDGPHPTKTPKILDVLKKYNVKATFFLIGENARLYPEVVKLIADEGHEIANHTDDHKSLYKEKVDTLLSSVKKCEETIVDITGKRPVLFRPPEGYLNDNIASRLKDSGYSVVLWRVDTYDWKGRSAEDIYETVIKTLKCGDIILMHDYISKKSNTAEALELIIPALIEEGYDFYTVSELIEK